MVMFVEIIAFLEKSLLHLRDQDQIWWCFTPSGHLLHPPLGPISESSEHIFIMLAVNVGKSESPRIDSLFILDRI